LDEVEEPLEGEEVTLEVVEEALLGVVEEEEAVWTGVLEVEAGVVVASKAVVEAEAGSKVKVAGEEGKTLPCSASRRSRVPPTSSLPSTPQSGSSAAGLGFTSATLDPA